MSEPRDNPLTDGLCFPLVLGITVGERVQVKIYNKNNNNSDVLEKESNSVYLAPAPRRALVEDCEQLVDSGRFHLYEGAQVELAEGDDQPGRDGGAGDQLQAPLVVPTMFLKIRAAGGD